MTPRFRLIPLLPALLAGALVLAGCTVGATPSSVVTPTSSASAAPSVGVLTEQEVQSILEEQAAELGVPGAVVLLRTAEGEATATYGTREFGGTEPVSPAQHIRGGSNTKTMTGTVVLQLVGEGRVALDDAVSQYRPDVPGGDDITIAHLLEMRSGLGNYSETYELNLALDQHPERAWDPEELIAMGLALPPYFAPGEGYHYSNTNTVLLGRIVEQIEGMPLGEVMQRRLFAPFGLDQTHFPEPTETVLPEPFSRGYMYTDNVRTLGTAQLPPDVLADARSGRLAPNDQTEANPTWAWSAGAVVSTAGDLADWAEVLATGGALDTATQAARLAAIQPTSDAAGSAGYGLAIAQMGPMLGHTGELPGYNSFMGHDPAHGVTLVVWANLAPAADGRDPATTIARALITAMYGSLD